MKINALDSGFDRLRDIVEQIKHRAPGPGMLWFTVDKNTLARIKWNPRVDPPIEQFIADEVGAIVQYDTYSNPQFQLTTETCRARTRNEIKGLLEYELRSRSMMFEPEKQHEELLNKIMAVIEKEGY